MKALQTILEDSGYVVVSVRKMKAGFYVRTTSGEFRLSSDYQPEDLEGNKKLINLLAAAK